MNTYFISDIHLDVTSAENSKLLLNFLHTAGPNADAIYILGDLFAIWLGDDIKAPYSEQLFNALNDLTAKNIPIYFMRGNRDFLIGNRFSKRTGVKVLPDPAVINLNQEPVLLTHGDQLCSADKNYQNFRSKVQHPLVKTLFLALPKFMRKKLGNYVRNKAKMPKTNAATLNLNLYDVVPATATTWFNKFKVAKMIHGHTHKPAIHHDGVNIRMVLGDWTATSAKILVCNSQGYELIDLHD